MDDEQIEGIEGQTDNSDGTCYVIDGGRPPARGSLIHRLPWMQGSSFGDICLMYYDYLYRNYKGDITVVFDGYK